MKMTLTVRRSGGEDVEGFSASSGGGSKSGRDGIISEPGCGLNRLPITAQTQTHTAIHRRTDTQTRIHAHPAHIRRLKLDKIISGRRSSQNRSHYKARLIDSRLSRIRARKNRVWIRSGDVVSAGPEHTHVHI